MDMKAFTTFISFGGFHFTFTPKRKFSSRFRSAVFSSFPHSPQSLQPRANTQSTTSAHITTTSTLNQTKRARVVQIYCPAYDTTIENFLITPSTGLDNVLMHIRAALRGYDVEDILLCDNNGEPLHGDDVNPSALCKVVHGERLLIALDGERIRPEPDLEVELYLEDESLSKDLRRLSRENRRNHVRGLRRTDALSHLNIVRLTLPHVDVLAALGELAQATPQQMKTKYSVSTSNRIIADHWFVKKVSKWEQRCLAAIAILSGATSGQPLVVEDMLLNAMRLRHEQDSPTDGLQEEDVRAVIQDLYQRAGAVRSEWPATRANRAMSKHDAKQKEYSKAKEKESRVRMEGTLGDDAAEAATPGGKRELEKLAGLMEKTSVPDNRMLESDEE